MPHLLAQEALQEREVQLWQHVAVQWPLSGCSQVLYNSDRQNINMNSLKLSNASLMLCQMNIMRLFVKVQSRCMMTTCMHRCKICATGWAGLHLQTDRLHTDDAAKHAHKLDDCQGIGQRAPVLLQHVPKGFEICAA